MSGFVVSSRVRVCSPAAFFSLCRDGAAGRWSATAAAMTTASAVLTAASTAACMSRALPTRTSWTPAGSGSSVGPQTSVTSAPRRAATRARAHPCRPLEWLLRYRTGSSGSWVAPAVTRTRRPTRSRDVPGCSSTARQAASRSSGSGILPGPESAPVSRPVAGSRTRMPRSRSVSTLAVVAACSHISVCMAGAISTGHRAVSKVAARRSSARPAAARASRSAVAGATRTRSACWPSRTCGTSGTSVNTSVVTGCPDSASQVAAPTNCSALAVGITRTLCPASVRPRTTRQVL
jgi:hypothetical protein